MARGQLTQVVSDCARRVLGIEDIGITELRLMPYIQYQMMNEQRLDPRKINEDERKILSVWREKGWIEGGASGLNITKEFWDGINEILWLSYVVGEGV